MSVSDHQIYYHLCIRAWTSVDNFIYDQKLSWLRDVQGADSNGRLHCQTFIRWSACPSTSITDIDTMASRGTRPLQLP